MTTPASIAVLYRAGLLVASCRACSAHGPVGNLLHAPGCVIATTRRETA